MDSQFFEKLTMTGYVGVRRWYSKVVPVIGCTDSKSLCLFLSGGFIEPRHFGVHHQSGESALDSSCKKAV